MMGRIWQTVFMALLMAVVVVSGGCTTHIAGRPTAGDSSEEPAAPSSNAVAGEDLGGGGRAAERREQFAALREVDPCSLLDREAIHRVTRAEVGIHVPGRHLSECRVDTDIDDNTPGWSFTVDVGLVYDPTTDKSRKEKIENETFYPTGDEHGCTYMRLVGDNIGVALRTLRPPATEPGATGEDPCNIAKSYITQAIDAVTEMGLRSQRLTEPQLPLASRDPCEAVPAVAQTMQTEAIGVPIKTYLCAVRPARSEEESSLAGHQVMIGYEFTPDPRKDVPSNPGTPSPPGDGPLWTLTAVTIAGHSGSQFKGSGDLGCSVDLVLDDQPVLQDGTQTLVQVVSIFSKDCEVSQRVAEAVITKVSGS